MNSQYKKEYLKYKTKYLKLLLSNQMDGGGKKNKQLLKCNSIFSIEEQIKWMKSLESYHPKRIEYMKEMLNQHKKYPSIKSNVQIKTVIDGGFQYINRLIQLCHEQLGGISEEKLFKLFTENKQQNDDYFYKELKTLFYNLKTKKKKQMILNIAEYLHLKIESKMSINLVKYLDIGSGNGWKCKALGELLGLKSKNIIGSDVDEWFGDNSKKRNQTQKGFEFLKIQENKPLKLDDNSVQLITIMHTLHHMKDRDTRLKDCNRLLSKGGLLVIVEHDVLTKEDNCLVDIEHAIFERVKSNNFQEFSSTYYGSYINWIEMDILMKKNGFEFISYSMYDRGINNTILPTQSYVGIYKKM